MTKLRGTEAEIYARLRELSQEFRQLRKELADSADRRNSLKATGGTPGQRDRPRRPARKPR